MSLDRQPPIEPIPAPLYDARFEHDACGVGFVADTGGRHRHRVLPMALEALAALAHRGARGADDRTGDGSGISIPISQSLRQRLLHEAGTTLAPGARVAIGMCFLPATEVDPSQRAIERGVSDAGLRVAGWRHVPVRDEVVAHRRIGETPAILQAVVVPDRSRLSSLAFARRLAVARRSIESASPRIAVPSLSERTVVYKGLFVGDELGAYYVDLGAADLAVPYALFHQRYSTNTFPSWRLAQPFRYLAHNGEINTIRANREAMRGRRRWLGRSRWARRLANIGPLVSVEGSDSESLDDALELLMLAGMPIEAALAELIPAAGGLGGPAEGTGSIEPWDGPAALVFADGRRVGCALDRNGLRPLAMSTTHDGLVVVSSEAGSVELAPERVARRHRLGPGEMVVVDLDTGTVRGPGVAGQRSSLSLRSVRPMAPVPTLPPAADARARVAHGLDAEVMRLIVKPMVTDGHEATWSMGDDTPIAPLARRPRRVTAFLRQAFAQVTNPAIDPERERGVMSLAMAIGQQAQLTGDGDATVRVEGPVLDEADWAALRASFEPRRVVALDATWARRRGTRGLATALDRLARQARAAERRGAHLVVVSDRAARPRRIAIPSILAVGRVHQALVAAGRRPACDIVVECGDAFDVHDVAMLLASGASAVHPWLLLELATEHAGARGAEALTPQAARANLVVALEAGLRKVLARMGISTLASYRGGQMFDVLGLDGELRDACFPAAACWSGAVGLAEFGAMLLARHRRAYAEALPALEDPGLVRFRGSGEAHAHAPRTVKALQAVVVPEPEPETELAMAAYRATLADIGPRQPRDLLALRAAGPPLPIGEVEPASRIARRFVSSAMSLGALSPEAHQAISIGMARLGGAANSGEGGEDPAWYAPARDGDRRDAAIKQVASARFGVTAEYLARAEQLEIKIAQGSKPGEGGQLPGRKVTPFIANLRRGQPGMTMISPPPHHDIYSIEDLAQLVGDLRAINSAARIGVKLVAGAGIGTIAAGVAKAQADYVMVSGHAGGTGASPLSSIKHVGLPWELGLAETHQVLVRNRLRDRVTLRTDGGLQTGRDVVVAALLGADEFGFGTAALVAIGCDMARQCHLDTCPTGIATQREDLRARFAGRPEDVVAFFMAIADDVRRELAGLGLHSLGAAVGRADLLRVPRGPALALDAIVRAPAWAPPPEVRDVPPRDRPLRPDRAADGGLEGSRVEGMAALVADGARVVLRERVTPRDRSIGAQLAGHLSRRPEPRQLPHVAYELSGSAGQSFGAFAVPGMRITIRGEANDYVAKGLSGGIVVVRPPPQPEAGDHALAGNVCLFGATAGTLHVVGRAGMRFAVRNSGARAVVEGIGAHGCEYMTGGTVVVLGPIGPNFGAGMTGGRAFLLDAQGDRVNTDSVAVRGLTGDEAIALRELVSAHSAEGSRMAASLLADWEHAKRRFSVAEPIGSAVSAASEVSPEPMVVAR